MELDVIDDQRSEPLSSWNPSKSGGGRRSKFLLKTTSRSQQVMQASLHCRARGENATNPVQSSLSETRKFMGLLHPVAVSRIQGNVLIFVLGDCNIPPSQGTITVGEKGDKVFQPSNTCGLPGQRFVCRTSFYSIQLNAVALVLSGIEP